MKKFISSAATSVILLFAGLCLAIKPSSFMNAICYIAGAVCIVIAALKFFSAYKKNTISKEAPLCIILLLLGAVLIFLQGSIISILPLIVGICFLFSGLLKLKSAYAFKNANADVYKKLMISALIGVVFALLIIILSGFIGELIYRLIGVLLIYNSLENIFDIVVSKPKNEKQVKKEKIEAEVEETKE